MIWARIKLVIAVACLLYRCADNRAVNGVEMCVYKWPPNNRIRGLQKKKEISAEMELGEYYLSLIDLLRLPK